MLLLYIKILISPSDVRSSEGNGASAADEPQGAVARY